MSYTGWIFNPTTGTWTNPATGQPLPPLVMAAGKQLTVNNDLTLQGVDGQTLDLSAFAQGKVLLGSAALASASSFQPAGAATGLSSTASDTITIGTGSQTFHTQTGLAYSSNMVITAYDTNNVTIFLQGAVTSYNTNTGVLVINVTNMGGSGSVSTWTISISGPQGQTGSTGAAGQPSGAIIAFGGSTPPVGFLLCTGAAVSRSTNTTTP